MTAITRSGWREWLKANLFRSPGDTLVTLAFAGVFGVLGIALVRYLVDLDVTILRVNLTLFMLGRFPRDQLWRPWLSLMVGAVLLALLAASSYLAAAKKAKESGLPFKPSTSRGLVRRLWPLISLVVLLLALTQTITPTILTLATVVIGAGSYRIFRGPGAGIARRPGLSAPVLLLAMFLILAGWGGVGWNGWGGLHLNLFLTVAGIVFAFPLGLMLALARRSSFPALRTVAVTYIEFIRGVPLITLLLMAIFAIGFFLPSGLRPDSVTRVLIAITLFEAAYIAEVVRGGLQSVPSGQVEASQALGMAPWKTTRLIVLPQALRATIPAMVGQFISLFKDTSLVTVVGLLELLKVSELANTQPAFLAQGLEIVTLPFVGLIFWVGCYFMSREARRLETRLGIGVR